MSGAILDRACRCRAALSINSDVFVVRPDYFGKVTFFFREGNRLLVLVGLLLVAGCSDPANTTRSTAGATNPPRYGEPTGKASDFIPRVRPHTNDTAWQSAPFWFVHTELSPATLFHSATKQISLFTGLTNSGLGAPSWLAFSTRDGPRSFTNGARLDVTIMEENWVLVWFAGARGWTNGDSPWVVYLQHKPTRMRLDADGLHFLFRETAGDVVVMPLYGCSTTPLRPATNSAAARPVKTETRPETWKWGQGLPRDPLVRIRYWAGATREFPIYCMDSFSVNRATDRVTLREQLTWHSIHDDWGTRHLKVAPISPPLALASQDRDFPARFSKPPMDYALATPTGPFLGIEDADSYDVMLPVVQYINEIEGCDPQDAHTNTHPVVAAALKRLQDIGRTKFGRADRYEYDGETQDDVAQAISGAQWFARALPYYDPVTRSNAVNSLRRFFRETVLATNRSSEREAPAGSRQTSIAARISSLSLPANSIRVAQSDETLLPSLWAYVHFSGDWDLVRERWALIQSLFTAGAKTHWSGLDRDGTTSSDDAASVCLAMARLAYRAGDMDTYNYACALFARELTLLWARQRGAEYFHRNQPWHAGELSDGGISLTNPAADIVRWRGFNDPEMARFWRDYFSAELRAELGRLQALEPSDRRSLDDSRVRLSLVRWRARLLNESPTELAAVLAPEGFNGSPADITASCLALLRAAGPVHLERLIPRGAPSPFVAGPERDVAGPHPHLVQFVQFQVVDTPQGNARPFWPLITGPDWRTPTGARWSFGQVRPVAQGEPSAVRAISLNWNTEAVVYPSQFD